MRGVTSNPSIFEKAVAGSSQYDDVVTASPSDDAEAAFFDLAVRDIADACDVLAPVYADSDAVDGYVSMEVSPRLARDTTGTVQQADRLFARIDRPNVMIKIPGTVEGLPAIEESVAQGVSVNVTLLFAVDRHMAAADAYIAGLERALDAGRDVARIASVASFFVSRVDSLVDAELDAIGSPEALALRGRAAVANAKLAYAAFTEKFRGPRWESLAAAGARVQRPLWASTSTKNPAYPDTLYVDELIGPDTVNTMPHATVDAFADHGTAAVTLTAGLDEAKAHMDALASLGVDMTKVTDQLEQEGVDAFVTSYEQLLATIAEKQATLRSV